MKRILTIGFATLIILNVAFAQKRSTILGDAFTGEVIATDDNTREIVTLPSLGPVISRDFRPRG